MLHPPEVLILSPTTANINGKLCSVLTNSLNLKGSTWSIMVCMMTLYCSMNFHLCFTKILLYLSELGVIYLFIFSWADSFYTITQHSFETIYNMSGTFLIYCLTKDPLWDYRYLLSMESTKSVPKCHVFAQIINGGPCFQRNKLISYANVGGILMIHQLEGNVHKKSQHLIK